jgi:hypothetical protein
VAELRVGALVDEASIRSQLFPPLRTFSQYEQIGSRARRSFDAGLACRTGAARGSRKGMTVPP